jgi:Arc/MetJ-type ribon-helix-helix transcriptional regulator
MENKTVTITCFNIPEKLVKIMGLYFEVGRFKTYSEFITEAVVKWIMDDGGRSLVDKSSMHQFFKDEKDEKQTD